MDDIPLDFLPGSKPYNRVRKVKEESIVDKGSSPVY
jgi:hypothetical protein